jgi:hypothetical protein
MGAKIIPRDSVYLGRTYSSYVTDWFNWFLSADADKRNFGPVVFLRASGLPTSTEGDKLSAQETEYSVSNIYADDINYVRRYGNTPNIRLGRDGLHIKDTQAVLVPIITAFDVARKPYNDWGYMSDGIGLTIDYGDNPPGRGQLLVDGEEILGQKIQDFRDFRIVTPMFPAVVPETDFGRSVKDFLEESFPAGNYAALVEGYFVLLTFDGGQKYVVHSFASAPREERGPYFSELIYEIDVEHVEEHKKGADYYETLQRGAQPRSPPRNRALITTTIIEKFKKGELRRTNAKNLLVWVKIAKDDKEAEAILNQV